MDEQTRPIYDPQNLPPPQRRTSRNDLEIDAVIQEFAKKCVNDPDPFARAEAYAIALIGAGWSAADARDVQVGALRMVSMQRGDDSLWPSD